MSAPSDRHSFGHFFWFFGRFSSRLDEQVRLADAHRRLDLWTRGLSVDQDADRDEGDRKVLFIPFQRRLKCTIEWIDEVSGLEFLVSFATNARTEKRQ